MLEFNATIIIAMISFIIFMVLMNIVLYQPVLAIVQRRKNLITLNENDIKENEAETKKLCDERDNKVEVARASSRSIIANMTTQAKKQRSEDLATATKEANEYLEGKVVELNGNVVQAKHEIKNDVVGLAQDILSKLSGDGVLLAGVSDEEYERVINNES